jgi:hypothetical protein
MLCQEVNDWTKKTYTHGLLPIGHTGISAELMIGTAVQTETSEVDKNNDRSINNKTTLTTSQASHQETPRSRSPEPKAVRMCHLDIHR